MSRPWARRHLFPVISSMIVIVGMVLVVETNPRLDPWLITLICIFYFLSNIAYLKMHAQFSLKRLLELGAVTILIALTSLSFLV